MMKEEGKASGCIIQDNDSFPFQERKKGMGSGK